MRFVRHPPERERTTTLLSPGCCCCCCCCAHSVLGFVGAAAACASVPGETVCKEHDIEVAQARRIHWKVVGWFWALVLVATLVGLAITPGDKGLWMTAFILPAYLLGAAMITAGLAFTIPAGAPRKIAFRLVWRLNGFTFVLALIGAVILGAML